MKKIYLSLLFFLFFLPSDLLAACLSSISFNTNVAGVWESSCASANRTGRYAKYYTFTVATGREITISLESERDTYLFLLNGSDQTGSVIAQNDDIAPGSNTNSRIVRFLAAGTYTVEATTFDASTTGSFVVSVSTQTPPSSACVKAISLNTNVSDSWDSACTSTHRPPGRYAKFFTFTLSTRQQATIDLGSDPDNYLYLLNGSGSTGSVIAEDDDSGPGTNAQIVRTLAAGTYTVEATTFAPATTGSFVVSVRTAPAPCTDCPFEINAGLNDAWFSTTTNGQGFTVTVFPEIKKVFVAWFTFDTVRPPASVTANLGEPGHRWLTAQGPYSGDKATLTIYVTEGGVFDSAVPATSTDQGGDGTLILEFEDCTAGLATYEITSLGISGEIPIERIVDDNVALCEALRKP